MEPSLSIKSKDTKLISPIQIEPNNYYIGDNIELLKNVHSSTIDLIYIDPPYNTGRDFHDYDDRFSSINSYIEFMRQRITECHRVLKNTGNIVIHVEPRVAHHFRILCDNIFGENKFKNEIAWQTGGNAKNKHKLNRYHNSIMVYSKSSNSTFNPIYFNYDQEYKKKSNVKLCLAHNLEYVTTPCINSKIIIIIKNNFLTIIITRILYLL